MVKVEIREELFEPIRRVADRTQTTVENVIDSLLSQQLALIGEEENHHASADTNLERDHQQFECLKAKLLQAHPGEYAVIKDGELVAVGPDQQTLVDEVYQRFGAVDLYVKRIDPVERVYRISGPRIVRSG
jgi:hypothetical protein